MTDPMLRYPVLFTVHDNLSEPWQTDLRTAFMAWFLESSWCTFERMCNVVLKALVNVADKKLKLSTLECLAELAADYPQASRGEEALSSKIARRIHQVKDGGLEGGGAARTSGGYGRNESSSRDRNDVASLWQALLAGTTEKSSILQLPQGMHFPFSSPPISSIYVRSHYPKLVDAILATKHISHVLLGTPGVGKSLFAWYILWLVANGDARFKHVKDVVLHYNHGVYVLNTATGECVKVTAVEHSLLNRVCPETHVRTSLYIADAVTALTGANPWLQILITSPKTSIWKEYQKQNRALKFFMPVWTREELQFARENCTQIVRKADDVDAMTDDGDLWEEMISMTQDEVDLAFDQYGGSARLVLTSPPANETDRLGYIWTKSLETIKSAVASVGENWISAVSQLTADSDNDMQLSHVVFHYAVEPGYQTKSIQLASDAVTKLFWSHVAATQREHIRVFLCSPRDQTAALRGNLFEPFVFDSFAHGKNCALDAVLLHGAAHGPWSIPQKVRRYAKLDELEVEPGVFYVPVCKSFAAVDAFYIEVTEGRLKIFGVQCTTASAHPISERGVQDLVLSFLHAGAHDNVFTLKVPTDLRIVKRKKNSGTMGNAEEAAAKEAAAALWTQRTQEVSRALKTMDVAIGFVIPLDAASSLCTRQAYSYDSLLSSPPYLNRVSQCQIVFPLEPDSERRLPGVAQ